MLVPEMGQKSKQKADFPKLKKGCSSSDDTWLTASFQDSISDLKRNHNSQENGRILFGTRHLRAFPGQGAEDASVHSPQPRAYAEGAASGKGPTSRFTPPLEAQRKVKMTPCLMQEKGVGGFIS